MAKVLVSMSDNFLESIDEIAKNEQRTRSELIREALRTYMQKSRRVASKKDLKNASILENLLD